MGPLAESSAAVQFSIGDLVALPVDLVVPVPAWALHPGWAPADAVPCTPPALLLEDLLVPASVLAWVRGLASASAPALDRALAWVGPDLHRLLRAKRRVRRVPAREAVAVRTTKRPKKAR